MGVTKPGLTAEALIAKYAQEAEEFEFTINTGDTLRARRIVDSDALMALAKSAEMIVKAASKRPREEWKPYLPASERLIQMAVYAEAMMIDPPMDFLTALRIGKTCGMLLPEIAGHIIGASGAAVAEDDLEEIEEAKNS